MNVSLDGRVAIVTGAGSGVGRGVALGLAEAGASVVIADVDTEAARGTAAQIAERRFPEALPVYCDVADAASVDALVAEAVDKYKRIDILVNNAGIAPSHPLTEFPEEDWDKACAINLKGYFLCAGAVVKQMRTQGEGGNIINISSKSGVRGSANNSVYNATKFGVIGLAQGWAQELAGEGIRVNSVLPGNVLRGSGIWNEEYIKARAESLGIKPEEVEDYYNAKVPLGRQCLPEDVANMVVFLVSEKAGYVTGCSHLVDGGQEMR